MRKLIVLSLFVFLIFPLSGLTVDERAQPTAAIDKPLIFLESSAGYPFASNAAYRQFAEMARSLGFRFDHGMRTEIRDDFLADISVLMLVSPTLVLLDEDKEAMNRFIKNGGIVFIVVYSADWHFWIDFTNLASFTRNYGVDFGRSTDGWMNGSVVKGGFLNGPEKVNTVRSAKRCALVVDKSKAAAQAVLDNGDVLTAISTNKSMLGKGRLIVHGDCSMMAAGPSFSYLELNDNENFAKNILNYFLSKYDLKVLISKMKKKIAVAGKLTTAVARIKNIGTTDSEKVKVQFIISDGESSEGKPADDIAVLKTIKLESIAPGKSIKIRRKVRIPSGLEPGDYYLITVVDPDGKSNDADPGNNRKVGKIFTVM